MESRPPKPRAAAPLQRLCLACRRALRRSALAQVVAIVAIWCACEVIVRLTHLQFPAGVLGMLLLLAALFLRLIRLPSLQRGADWLMAEMLLFFIPTVPVLIDHPEFFGMLGAKLLAAVLIGTALVMLATGCIVELSVRLADKPSREASPHEH